MRLIGSPYASSSLSSTVTVDPRLLSYSFKNRISLLYLEKIKKAEEFKVFREIYNRQIAGYNDTFEALARVSQTLSKANIKYTTFKALRPYISTTVDIDVLIFGNTLDYEKAFKALKTAGYLMLVRGPESTTFQDPKVKIGVDLYNEVAVSHIIYVDKDKLESSVTTKDLPNGQQVEMLTCEADLLSIIAHSIIKENMYVLSEYYTYIYYLDHLNVNHFIKLAKETLLTNAVSTHTAITSLLSEVAHKRTHPKLQQIQDMIGVDSFALSRVVEKRLVMPHKYHPITSFKSLLELTQGKNARKSIATQMFHMLNPNFSKNFLRKLIDHVMRETY